MQCRFKGFSQTQLQIRPDFEAIDHHFDGMFLLQFQCWRVRKITDLTINAGADITLRGQTFQQLLMLPFTVTHHRRQNHHLAVFRLRQHPIHHLADRLCCQRQVVFRTTRFTYAGIQQAQVIVDFGDSADGGTRVMRSGFLFDGDRRR